MPVVTVSQITFGELSEGVGFHLEAPIENEISELYALTFTGWVMGEQQPPVKLQLRGEGTDHRDIPLGIPRADLAEIYPETPWAISNSGFNVSVSVLRWPEEFELEMYVVFGDESEAKLATITGRHDFPGTNASGLRPIMITTLGRTGSTWMTQLLGGHPGIITYPPFHHEVRLASYWLEVFLSLTEPQSYLQGVQALVSESDWWLGRARTYDEETEDDDMLQYLGRHQVEALSVFCKQRIDGFYKMLAEREGTKDPIYFAEKALPQIGGQILALRGLYPGVREIVLVRDFRDMLSSIFAYNERRQFPFFNRHLAEDDVDYVRRFIGPDVMMLKDAYEQRADSAHLVRYEDLITDPRPTLRSMLAYLELDDSDESLDAMLGSNGRVPLEGHQEHRTAPSAEESIGRWREDLDGELLAECNEGFGSALERFGYDV